MLLCPKQFNQTGVRHSRLDREPRNYNKAGTQGLPRKARKYDPYVRSKTHIRKAIFYGKHYISLLRRVPWVLAFARMTPEREFTSLATLSHAHIGLC